MISERDKARYPFTTESADYVKKLRIEINDLITEPYKPILKRAEERIRLALLKPDDLTPQEHDPSIEILSFPTSIMLMAYIDNENVKRRYAVAESKGFSKKLKTESLEKVIEIAQGTFYWNIKSKGQNLRETYEIFLHFIDYIKNIKNMNDLKWKLTNRYLKDGYVEITKNEATRLIEEEIQSKILKKTKNRKVEPPKALKEILETIKRITMEKTVFETFDTPSGSKVENMPPCIKKLLDGLSAGGRLSHLGRFTLTSFLVNTGATEEDVMTFFKSASDFDENKTKYQIEHISGRKGGKTKYKPPKCDTLKTHGLCFSPDEICNRIVHPLTYYRLKMKALKKK